MSIIIVMDKGRARDQEVVNALGTLKEGKDFNDRALAVESGPWRISFSFSPLETVERILIVTSS